MIFVVIPREAYDRYVNKGWAEMLTAARNGDDGLRVIEEPKSDASVRLLDHAVFRDGATAGLRTPDSPALHSQGW